MHLQHKHRNIIGAALLIIAAIAAGVFLWPGEYHVHTNFAVFVSGQPLNFSNDRFMHHEVPGEHNRSAPLEDDDKVHMHDNVGWVVHAHAMDATWGMFFENLNATFDPTCFGLDGMLLCTNQSHALRFFVNGQENTAFDTFPIRDLDRILVTYGPRDANISAQVAALADDACIYSRRCPERGEAASEECTTGGASCT